MIRKRVVDNFDEVKAALEPPRSCRPRRRPNNRLTGGSLPPERSRVRRLRSLPVGAALTRPPRSPRRGGLFFARVFSFAGVPASVTAMSEDPADRAPPITYDDFRRVDIRVGTIVAVEPFPEARRPAVKLTIDFGAAIGLRRARPRSSRTTVSRSWSAARSPPSSISRASRSASSCPRCWCSASPMPPARS